MHVNIYPQLVGYPRIGPNRELKWALERRWAGRSSASVFLEQMQDLRAVHLAEQRELIGSSVDDFFLYDEVLETAMMLGASARSGMPTTAGDEFDQLTALARGTSSQDAWEMTKWFDTNYHYVVPVFETDFAFAFRPLPWREPTFDADVTWVVLGPYSLAKLSKYSGGADPHQVATRAAAALAAWVGKVSAPHPGFRLQLDEPSLGLILTEDDARLRDAAYAELQELGLSGPPLVSVQFGHASDETVRTLGALGFAVQTRIEDVAAHRANGVWDTQPEHVVSVMDGRSVWPDHLASAQRALQPVLGEQGTLRLVPSTSFMFLPYTVEGEELPAGFQFAREKAQRLAQWVRALTEGGAPDEVEPPMAPWPEVGGLVPRESRPQRRDAQRDLDLPRFPTTSTGSLPQTTEVRHLRVQLARGEIEEATYRSGIDRLIADAIRWQEAKGLDVLVHGEFERSDMVEYFAERMDGFFTTRSGWVLSYGSRCTRPPILDAPPSIAGPITVREWEVAQAATSKPVKGMLTGPVTIVNWSFRPPGVPDDRLFWAVAGPIAEEVGHLVEAGARVVQVDEPAVRERWPLPTDDASELRGIYARGVRAALNRVFNQPVHVQMHTHMCYGDFGEIVPLWSEAGVDVASIEFSRSKDDSYIHQFYELFQDGHLQIGPGVFDVHSPHSPGREVMTDRLNHFRDFMGDEDLWINPDCGLKTRSWEEIDRQLGDMVAAATRLRDARDPGAREPAAAIER